MSAVHPTTRTTLLLLSVPLYVGCAASAVTTADVAVGASNDAGLDSLSAFRSDASSDVRAEGGSDASVDVARDVRFDATTILDATNDVRTESSLDAVQGSTDTCAERCVDDSRFGLATSISAPVSGREFGAAVSLSHDGNVLAVGDPDGGGDYNGAVVVFVRALGVWNEGTALARPPGARDYGGSVALAADGRVLIVGDPNGADANGSARIYQNVDGVWNTGTDLMRPRGVVDYGSTVGLTSDGARAVVSDYNGGGDGNGAAITYRVFGSEWRMDETIRRPANTEDFGGSVAIAGDGSSVVVGDQGTGAAWWYVRGRDGALGSGTQISLPAGAFAFGAALALSFRGDTLAVGDNVGPDRRGAVSVYHRTSNGWARPRALDVPAHSDLFGRYVAMSSDGATIAVGDFGGAADLAGAVSIYFNRDATWTAGEAIERPVGAASFGAVALSGDGRTLAVGDWNGGTDRGGAVAIYQR